MSISKKTSSENPASSCDLVNNSFKETSKSMDAQQKVRTFNFKYVPAIGYKQNGFRFFLVQRLGSRKFSKTFYVFGTDCVQ